MKKNQINNLEDTIKQTLISQCTSKIDTASEIIGISNEIAKQKLEFGEMLEAVEELSEVDDVVLLILLKALEIAKIKIENQADEIESLKEQRGYLIEKIKK